MTTQRPLRILMAADTYPPDVNGAAVFGHRLATHMQARGHEMHVAAARTGPGPDMVEDRDGVHIFCGNLNSQVSFRDPQGEVRLLFPLESAHLHLFNGGRTVVWVHNCLADFKIHVVIPLSRR